MPEYDALPGDVTALCKAVSAPPRLIAHLTLVHDVARKLVTRAHTAFPDLNFDDAEVLFGAATHDIGKSLVPQELSEKGNLHEKLGKELLINLGVSTQRARFAFTHGSWENEPSIQMEYLLVALADKCWKGQRAQGLENKAAEEIVRITGKPQWEVFAQLDNILQDLAEDADQRLAWQSQFPV